MSEPNTLYIIKNITDSSVKFESAEPFKMNSYNASHDDETNKYNAPSGYLKPNQIYVIDFNMPGQNVGRGQYNITYNPNEKQQEFCLQDIKNGGTCALLRTNPKLTGNIKLVIDSKNNIYLDTFSINDTLSKNKYHKIPVSSKSYYGRDVMSAFRDITSDSLYDLPKEYKTIFSEARTLKNQYADIYRCGVSTNDNELYKESFSIFAPIKIGNVLPDFFVVFRLKNSTPQSISDENFLQYLIENGTQVKTFDLRESSNIGAYLKQSQTQAKSINSPVYITKNENAWNSFYGISIDKGVIAEAREIVSKFEPYSNIDLNYIISTGFERHRLVAHDILNIEFMFDDPEVEQFSTNTYFGLYLYANVLNENIYGLLNDEDDVIFKSTASDTNGVKLHQIKNLDSYIVGFTSNFGEKFYRTTSTNEELIKKEVSNRVGDNTIYCDATKCVINDNYNSFISFTLNAPLEAGEHLRILITTGANNLSSKNYIYDVILSNSDTYANTKNKISNESIYYSKHTFVDSGVSEDVEFVTHGIAVSNENLPNNDSERIKEQANRIYKAFLEFEDAPFYIFKQNNTFVIYEKKDSVSGAKFMFERISSIVGHEEKTILSQTEDDSKKVSYFGNYEGEPIIVDPEDMNDALYSIANPIGIMFNPFYFETLGKRIVYGLEFINISADTYSLYEGSVTIQDGVISKELCFKDGEKVKEYANATSFELKMLKKQQNNEGKYYLDMQKTPVNYIYSFNNPSKYMFRYPSGSTIKSISLYEHAFINYVICGIFPIKDFNFDIPKKEDSIEPSLLNYAKIYNNNTIKSFEELYNSGVFTYSESPVSRTNCWWVTNGTGINKDGITTNFVKAIHTDEDDIYSNINESNDEKVYPDYITYDMSKIIKNPDTSVYIGTAKDALINGTITVNDILQSVTELTSADLKTKIYKIDDNIVSYVTKGKTNNIKFVGTEASDITEALNNTNLYFISSPFIIGENGNSDLFIDTENGVSLLVMYGDKSKYFEEMTKTFSNSGFGEVSDNASVYYPIPQKITKNDINIVGSIIKLYGISRFFETNGNIILYSNNACINGSYKKENDIIGISNASISFQTSISKNKETDNESLSNCMSNPTIFDTVLSKNDNYVIFATKTIRPSQNEISSINVYVKSGTENFTQTDSETSANLTCSNAIQLKPDSSIYYLPSYYTEELIDAFSFGDESFSEKDEKQTLGIKNACVGKASNVWSADVAITEYANNVQLDQKQSKTVLYKDATKNPYKLSNNSFSQKLYVQKSNDNQYTSINGYESGYLIKTYLNGLAIQRKNANSDTYLEITKWTRIHKRKNKVYYDLTNSVINHILSNSAFNEIWSYMGISNISYKRMYILNTILPLIKFDKRCQIGVEYVQDSKNSFSSTKLNGTIKNPVTKLNNPSAKLIKLNGLYYIELEPSASNIGKYAVSCKINM